LREDLDNKTFFSDKATLFYLLLGSHCLGLAKNLLRCRGKAIETATEEIRANVNFDIDAICDGRQKTALSLAVSQYDPELVRILLDQGAATKRRGQDEYRPRLLEQATRQYCRIWESLKTPVKDEFLERPGGRRDLLSRLNEIARMLLDHGAPVGEWDDCSPLHWAAMSLNIEMVRSLLEHGAVVDANKHRGITALISATQASPPDGITIETSLQSGADVTTIKARHYSFSASDTMVLASKTDQEEIVRLLLRHGADPHYRSSIAEEAKSIKKHVSLCRHDGTALGAALSRRNVNVARILWQAELSSPLTITIDSGHSQSGEWDFMCYGRDQQLWDDTKSELSGISERRRPNRGYAKYRRSRLTRTTGEPDYTAMKR
jgi:hypothetical protein